MEQDIFSKINKNQYYLIIAAVSLFALFFLPMLGSSAGLAWSLPTTTPGWIVYVTTKLLIAAINILITFCFVQQGKVNIEDNPAYMAALAKFNTQTKETKLKARSPQQFYAEIYGKRSIAIFLTSMLSAVALTQAVLTFDWVMMLTYLFTLTMGIIGGIIQMKDVEKFWTEEFVRYVAEKEEEKLHGGDPTQTMETAEGDNTL